MKELVQQLTEAHCCLDKCYREKISVTAELEVARCQLNNVDVDYGKVSFAFCVIFCDIVLQPVTVGCSSVPEFPGLSRNREYLSVCWIEAIRDNQVSWNEHHSTDNGYVR